jgi:hypothetical protein
MSLVKFESGIVFRKIPTEVERRQIADGNFLGTLCLKVADSRVAQEEALAAEGHEHPYIFSQKLGPQQLLVPASSVEQVLRAMYDSEDPDTQRYGQAATAFVGMSEVLAVPFSRAEVQ